ncbi:hypothetical protein psal_cds_103 [Pandoravirus salinus]|uniref:F-box incomplete domain containing protein n=1 Tax=Pandoravirus salinus TaxID=1349410 RepID=S4VTC0_9VIRU|nr:hypothetical protein psal_cds_103 [Pandoravirus salinus]AGO83538.1 hypothetical protein psal_cds_103 [Pandoravirus salinus]
MAADLFARLPDELAAAVLAHLGPTWRPLARMVCRQWAAIVAVPSRAEALALLRSRPTGVRPEAWVGGRVLCASAIAHGLDAGDAVQGDHDDNDILSRPSSAASWCLRFVPAAPPCEVAHALLASGRADAVACALALVGDVAPARSDAIALGVRAAVREDRADTLDALLSQWRALSEADTEDAPGATYDAPRGQRAWIDDVWTWVARHDAGRVAARLLGAQKVTGDPLWEAWSEGGWADAVGLAGAVRVVAAHVERGVFSSSLAERIGVAAAGVGHVRTCALVVDSLRSRCRNRDADAAMAAADKQQQRGRCVRAADDDPPSGRVIAQIAAGAVCGHTPDGVLDWLEGAAVSYRPDRARLLREAVEWGPLCGRSALALVVRWPETARAAPDLVARAVGRAVLRGYLDDADRAVAALHAVRPTAPHESDAHGRALWNEIVLDVFVSGLTKRTAVDTLALLCAMGARCGFGDAHTLVAVLAVDGGGRGDARYGPRWACFAVGSAEMWVPWCRARPIAGAFVRGLVRRIEPRHAHVAKALVAWLGAAGLLLDGAP